MTYGLLHDSGHNVGKSSELKEVAKLYTRVEQLVNTGLIEVVNHG